MVIVDNVRKIIFLKEFILAIKKYTIKGIKIIDNKIILEGLKYINIEIIIYLIATGIIVLYPLIAEL